MVMVSLPVCLSSTDWNFLKRSARSDAPLCLRAWSGVQGREGPGNSELINRNRKSIHCELTKDSAHLLSLDSTIQSHGPSFGCSLLICKMEEESDSGVP